ncbi:MAG: ribosome maturation factor RimP [Acidiferrobacterales bacterium]|jgi:ribosome maturation factor RimP
MMAAVRSELRDVLEPTVTAMGFELVHVELAGSSRNPVLRVYMDGPGGVSVGDCARVSTQLSAVLDVEDRVEGPYMLEVSSPGLDRPLVKRADFERFAGEIIKIRMRAPLAGQRNFKGCLIGISGDHVLLDVGQEKLDLAFESIEKARLVPRL